MTFVPVVAGADSARHGRGPNSTLDDGAVVAHTLRASAGADGSENGTGRGEPLAPLYYSHDYNQDRIYGTDGPAPAHTASDSAQARRVLAGPGVRRLTPRECERLQGLPDDWTLIPLPPGLRRFARKRPWEGAGVLAADAPRLRAIGNGMAVPVVRWIGERIALFERARPARRGGNDAGAR